MRSLIGRTFALGAWLVVFAAVLTALFRWRSQNTRAKRRGSSC